MQNCRRRLKYRVAQYVSPLVLGAVLVACGGTTTPPGQAVTVTVSPTTLKLAPGAAGQVSATVTGSSNTSVTWSATGGTITGASNTVTYTAPVGEGSYSVTATSNADSSKSATVTVQVSEGATDLDGWVRQFGAHLYDEVVGVALDLHDGVVAAGNTRWTIPGGTLVGKNDAFVIMFDANGDDLWVTQFGSLENDVAAGVTVDSDDTIVVVGTTYGLVGDDFFGLSDGFVVKFGADGNELWATQFGTTNYDWISAVALDADGNVIVVGQTQGTFPGNTKLSALDGFVAKFDQGGDQLWVTQFGSGGEILVNDVVVGADGSIFLVGETGAAMPGTTAAGGDDAYLAKFGSNGTPAWYLQIGTEETDYAVGVTADGDGNIIVVGGTEGEFAEGTPEGRVDTFVIKYTSDGDELWAQQFGSPAQDSPKAVAVGAAGSVSVVGDTRGAMPGNTSSGKRDVYVAELAGASGVINWIWQYGTDAGDEAAVGVAVASNGDVVVAGDTTGVMEPGFVKGGQPTNQDGFVLMFAH